MDSPGLKHLVFIANFLRSTGSKTTTIRPSNRSDSVYDDLVRVLREYIDEDAIPRTDGSIAGIIEMETDRFGEMEARVAIHEDRVELELI